MPAVYGRPPRLTQYDELNTGGLHGEGTYIAVGANNDKIAGGDAWLVDVLTASAVDPNRAGGVTPARHLPKAEGFDRLRLYPMSGAEPPNAAAVAQRYVLATAPQTPAGFIGASRRIALVKNTSGGTSGAFVQTANSAAAASAIGVILISTTTNPGPSRRPFPRQSSCRRTARSS